MAHDDKRRARFEAAGLTAGDLRYAETAYLGRSDDNCCLCDTGIIHNFRLSFDLPATDPRGLVVMEPVGSQCITDWMRAFPASPERDAALARVKDAEKEKNRQMAEHKRRETLLATLEPAQARQLGRYYDAPAAVRENETLADIVDRVERTGRFASYKQFRYFAARLREAILEQPVQTAAPKPAPRPKPTPTAHVHDPIPMGIHDPIPMGTDDVPPMPAALMQHAPTPSQGTFFAEEEPAAPASDIDDRVARLHLDDDGAGLMRRYYALPTTARDAELLDIAARVEQRGFASDRQRRFFSVRLKAAEMSSKGAPVGRGRARERLVAPPVTDDFPW